MEKLYRKIQFECPACDGSGVEPKNGFKELSTIPETCSNCLGEKTLSRYVEIDISDDVFEAIDNIAPLTYKSGARYSVAPQLYYRKGIEKACSILIPKLLSQQQ